MSMTVMTTGRALALAWLGATQQAQNDVLYVYRNVAQKDIAKALAKLPAATNRLFQLYCDYTEALQDARRDEAKRLNGGVYDFPTYARLCDEAWGLSPAARSIPA